MQEWNEDKVSQRMLIRTRYCKYCSIATCIMNFVNFDNDMMLFLDIGCSVDDDFDNQTDPKIDIDN